ncbi:hypothetical protein [Clostridium sp.]|uniref:hypothetical protein n=1 Tax=Clostridium sp. TaxID=1506 RepID=UPI003D6D4B63
MSIFNFICRHRRAERIDWIKSVLQDEYAELYEGYDSKSKTCDNSRRVAIITEDDYFVIIRFTNGLKRKMTTDSGSVVETFIYPKL